MLVAVTSANRGTRDPCRCEPERCAAVEPFPAVLRYSADLASTTPSPRPMTCSPRCDVVALVGRLRAQHRADRRAPAVSTIPRAATTGGRGRGFVRVGAREATLVRDDCPEASRSTGCAYPFARGGNRARDGGSDRRVSRSSTRALAACSPTSARPRRRRVTASISLRATQCEPLSGVGAVAELPGPDGTPPRSRAR